MIDLVWKFFPLLEAFVTVREFVFKYLLKSKSDIDVDGIQFSTELWHFHFTT